MTLNLDELKQEITEYLNQEDFVIFRGQPAGLKDLPVVFWDDEQFPDFHGFLNAAKSIGAKLIFFAYRQFQEEDIEQITEALGDCQLSREERREVEGSVRQLQPFAGSTCSLDLAFDYQGKMYVYSVLTEWFEMFLELAETVDNAMGDDVEDDEGPLGSGFFSKN
ncbi:MAG: hypothetical protein ACRD8O_17220 [Bryobacteraceae bacterium]